MKDQFDALHAVILGVSFDSIERNLAFADKYDFNYPLLCDTTKQMGIAYGAAESSDARTASRAGVIIDKQGKILMWSGKVNSRRFPQQALDVLEQTAD